MYLLYTYKKYPLILPIFLRKNTKSCITLLAFSDSVSPSSIFYPRRTTYTGTDCIWVKPSNGPESESNINDVIFFTVLFMPPKELWEAYSNRTVRPSVRQSVRVSVRPAFVSGPYLLYSLRQEFQIWCVDTSWDGGVSHTIFGLL